MKQHLSCGCGSYTALVLYYVNKVSISVGVVTLTKTSYFLLNRQQPLPPIKLTKFHILTTKYTSKSRLTLRSASVCNSSLEDFIAFCTVKPEIIAFKGSVECQSET